MYKVRSAFQQYLASVVAIQCLWRCRQAKREFRKLKQVSFFFPFDRRSNVTYVVLLVSIFVHFLQEANESGALRLAKTKLEKQLEELTWRLHLEKKIRVLHLKEMMLWMGCILVHFNTSVYLVFLHQMCFGMWFVVAASTFSYKFSTRCACIFLNFYHGAQMI